MITGRKERDRTNPHEGRGAHLKDSDFNWFLVSMWHLKTYVYYMVFCSSSYPKHYVSQTGHVRGNTEKTVQRDGAGTASSILKSYS